jgi:NAD(P)H-flavin reductase
MLLVAELDQLKAQHQDTLKLTYLASKADETWTGLKGRINKDLIA